MKISIIIPTLNEAEKLADLLQGISQIPTEYAYEIIVVDSGSQDETVKVARKYGRVYQFNQKSRGAQLQYGAKKSRGEILWFLHGDSTLDYQKDLFKEIVASLADKNISAGFFQLAFKDSDLFYRYLEVTSNWRAVYLGLIFGDQGLFTTRENYEAVGGFEAVPLMEDWLISRKLRKIGKFQIVKIPIYTSSRRFKNGKLRTHLAMHKIKLLFLSGIPPDELARRYYKKEQKHDRKNQKLHQTKKSDS